MNADADISVPKMPRFLHARQHQFAVNAHRAQAGEAVRSASNSDGKPTHVEETEKSVDEIAARRRRTVPAPASAAAAAASRWRCRSWWLLSFARSRRGLLLAYGRTRAPRPPAPWRPPPPATAAIRLPHPLSRMAEAGRQAEEHGPLPRPAHGWPAAHQALLGLSSAIARDPAPTPIHTACTSLHHDAAHQTGTTASVIQAALPACCCCDFQHEQTV